MDIQDQFFACNCKGTHFSCNHYLSYGKCSYINCECEKFNQSDFELLIEITKADIFELETNTREERYSIIWWELFKIWLEGGEKEDADLFGSNIENRGRNLFPGFQ